MALVGNHDSKKERDAFMKKHTKIYLQGMGYDQTDFIPCEVCNGRAVDIHHIEARGMGGNKKADHIENLMALCRDCHVRYGDIKKYKEWLQDIHENKLFKR
jgi:5-methylcytosine-specific restriction endonuclease McrA